MMYYALCLIIFVQFVCQHHVSCDHSHISMLRMILYILVYIYIYMYIFGILFLLVNRVPTVCGCEQVGHPELDDYEEENLATLRRKQ